MSSLAACHRSTNDAAAPEACEAPKQWLYTQPGCGPNLAPSCLGAAGACGGLPACACDGSIIETRCDGGAAKPYQFRSSERLDPSKCEAAPDAR